MNNVNDAMFEDDSQKVFDCTSTKGVQEMIVVPEEQYVKREYPILR